MAADQQRERDTRQSWDVCKEVPIIQDEESLRKRVQCFKFLTSTIVGIFVFVLVLLSKTSFLFLVSFGNNHTEIISQDQKPTALIATGFIVVAPSILLLLKSVWKFIFKSAVMPAKRTVCWVLFVELLVAFGSAVITTVAMPHFGVVTNVMFLNSVCILSSIFQVIADIIQNKKQCVMFPICSVVFTILGFVLFVTNYMLYDCPVDIKISVGLAIGGSICVSMNWWENYGTLSKNSTLERISKDIEKSRNVVCILSSLVRIIVTAAVVGGYVTMANKNWQWKNLKFEKVIIILVVIQIVSSALCRWFVVVACKMHALRRSFIIPMYMSSVTVLACFLVLYGFPTYIQKPPSIVGNETSNEWLQLLLSDTMKTLSTRLIVEQLKIDGLACLGCSALCWWLGLIFGTIYIWFWKIQRIERTRDLFLARMYEGAFLEQSMLLNARFVIREKKEKTNIKKESVEVFLCATMWHETYDEMMKIIISMFRLDKYRPKEGRANKNDAKFEFHIYFDDAFKDVKGKRHVNEYTEILVDVIKEVYIIFGSEDSSIFKQSPHLPDQKIIDTPYGGRLEYTLPKGNMMMVHLKDKKRIRHKKRWSQIMYLYYILGWRLNRPYFKKFEEGVSPYSFEEELEKKKRNTYILALDGDTDFQPSAVMLLIDRLILYPEVGAACGRIHPTGQGPMVWYQKFEYAVGHWLQKTAEHVFGCVLCSPGCFSLFRGAALMDDNVMKKYTTKASEASQYVQYDQGEDRWLCTLLLQQGWRVEYNAASDAYTNAPQDFKEFYNQRRRWGPSTMANTIDLLSTARLTSRRNTSFSKPYILYQIVSMAASILGPATICLMISGSFVFLFKMDNNSALALAIVPPAIYIILCFKLKSDTQIKIAAIMSTFYAFLMAGTVLSIVGDLVREKTFMTPSGLFLMGMVTIYIITAVLHPQEFSLVLYGLLYIICIPSGYLLLVIYSIVNMNNVSWGTRESGGQAKSSAVDNIKMKIMNAICCKCPCLETKDVESKEMLTENTTKTEEPQIPQETQSANESTERQCENWIEQLQEKSCDIPLNPKQLDDDEIRFWNELKEKYLEPLQENKEQQEKIANDLIELRNKVTFVFFFSNALWLVATFFLQAISQNTDITIKIPKFYLNGSRDPFQEYSIDPIALMFLLSFAILLLIQFFAMLYHRIYTLIHFVAYVDTEIKDYRRHSQQITKNSSYNPDDMDENNTSLTFQNPSTGHII